MSASFACKVISCETKVKIHGVTRREGKGIPTIVKQLEVQNIKEVEKVRNTIKVAVLEGDAQTKDLLAISYYDSKPCYFLSTVINKVNWVTCRKWWFSIFLWGLDVSMVNAYLLYKSWMEMHKSSPISHYRFRERIAEAWMDSDNYWKERYPKRRKLVSQALVCLSGKSINQLSTGSI